MISYHLYILYSIFLNPLIQYIPPLYAIIALLAVYELFSLIHFLHLKVLVSQRYITFIRIYNDVYIISY